MGTATHLGLSICAARALWDPAAVPRTAPLHHPASGAADAVWVIVETGFSETRVRLGRRRAQDRAVKRPAKVDHLPERGVSWLCRSAGAHMRGAVGGLYVHEGPWPRDRRARCQQGRIPDERGFATKPPAAASAVLVRGLHRRCASAWVTGDRVSGHDRRAAGQESGWLGGRPARAKTILAAFPEED